MKQAPIVPVGNQEGYVEVTRYVSQNLYEPVFESLVAHRRAGTVCILTQTNLEAATMVALLRKRGVECRLVQSLDSFAVADLAEMRYFCKQLDRGEQGPVYSDAEWEAAKEMTRARYQRSECMPYVMRCIAQFERISRVKYRSDFVELIRESSVEDFYEMVGTQVVVSTIHKAKGREYDDVYMLLAGERELDDSLSRCWYVGFSRAKGRLFVHTSSNALDGMPADMHNVDERDYPKPTEIVLQVSHKGVYLSHFQQYKRLILGLQSGDAIRCSSGVLSLPDGRQELGRLSSNMKAEVAMWAGQGYRLASAKVRFVVAWRPKLENGQVGDEIAVLLPDLSLAREGQVERGVAAVGV